MFCTVLGLLFQDMGLLVVGLVGVLGTVLLYWMEDTDR